MTDKTIDQYFSPKRLTKRPRSNSSPGSSSPIMDSEKVGNITHGQLMEGLAGLLDSKLANLATKEDLKIISNQVEILTEDNRKLQEAVSSLKAEQNVMRSKLLDLESRSRRNNLIFKGLKWDPKTKDFRLIVRNFCRDMFGSDDKLFVNRAHPLGRNNNAIIAHFPDDGDIAFIMTRTKNLKGTSFVVHRDFPSEVREKRHKLFALRAEIERVSGNRRMPIYYDYLMVEGHKFTWCEGKLREGLFDGAKRLQEITRHDFEEFLKKLEEGDKRPNQRQASHHQSSSTTQG